MENEPNVSCERAKVCLTLVDNQMRQFNSTRDIKWKVNFSLWTFFALVIHGYSGDSQPKQLGELAYYIVAGLLLAHIVWMGQIQKSLDFDKQLWVSYRAVAEQELNLCIPKPKKGGPFKLGWVILESGVTALLGLFAAVCAS